MTKPTQLELPKAVPATLGQTCAIRIWPDAPRSELNALAKIIDDTAKELARSHEGKDIPPSPEAVTAYFQEISYPMDGEAFCDFYAARGWKVGKVPMKDWKASCRLFKRNGWGQPSSPSQSAKSPQNGSNDRFDRF